MKKQQLSRGIFIIAVAALAASAGFAVYSFKLAPAETYAPPSVSAGPSEPPPTPLCDESDIPPPEGGVPEGYVWRVKPEACFGYPLPDFAYVTPPLKTVLDNGRVLDPPDLFATSDIVKAVDGRFQLLNIGIVMEGRAAFTGTLDPIYIDELRLETRSDGASIRYGDMRHEECGKDGGICTAQAAYVIFPDKSIVSLMLSVFPDDFIFPEGYDSRRHESKLPVLTEGEVISIVETVARLVRLK